MLIKLRISRNITQAIFSIIFICLLMIFCSSFYTPLFCLDITVVQIITITHKMFIIVLNWLRISHSFDFFGFRKITKQQPLNIHQTIITISHLRLFILIQIITDPTTCPTFTITIILLSVWLIISLKIVMCPTTAITTKHTFFTKHILLSSRSRKLRIRFGYIVNLAQFNRRVIREFLLVAGGLT